MMSVEDTLRGSFLFSDFPVEEIRRLAQICTTRKLDRGEIVFEEEDPGDSLLLVERGSIRIFRVLTETYDETLAMLGPGGVFGEMSFIDRVSRSSSAVAVTSSHAVELSRSDFDVIFSKQPFLASKVIRQIARIMATRIRSTDEKLSEAVRWLQEIRQWSEWNLEKLPRKATTIEIAVRGIGCFTGRMVEIAQNQMGHAFFWEGQDGRISWTPAHALYYLRVLAGEKAAD